jgi:hypothetical protein
MTLPLPCVGIALTLLLSSCGDPETAEGSFNDTPGSESVIPAPAAAAPAAPGSADISLNGDGVAVSGTFPARLCGGPYLMGKGMSYQTRANDWQITIASEERLNGTVPLNQADGGIQVVATVNGPGMQFVRGPKNGGTLTVSDDFRHAQADLELRSIATGATAHLVATFTCEAVP